MTAKRRLTPLKEVEAYLILAQRYGVEIGHIDIRSDGLTISRSPANDPVVASPSQPRELTADEQVAKWKAGRGRVNG